MIDQLKNNNNDDTIAKLGTFVHKFAASDYRGGYGGRALVHQILTRNYLKRRIYQNM